MSLADYKNVAIFPRCGTVVEEFEKLIDTILKTRLLLDNKYLDITIDHPILPPQLLLASQHAAYNEIPVLGKRSNGNEVNAIGVIIIGSVNDNTIYTGKAVIETDKFTKKKMKATFKCEVQPITI